MEHGCITATTKVLDDVITALATFIDLAKAFDSVDHRILLYKLSSIGLSSSSCDWFANYLTNHVQQLKVENIMSDPLIISKGVPQGSILGPTLFSIYINDIARAAGTSRIHLYADDTILYSVGSSPNTAASSLKLSFTSIEQFFDNLHLRINTSKTKCILFSRKPVTQTPLTITCMNGMALEYVKKYKYLGIWLDSSLSFITHINNLQTKVKARLAFLFRNKASFTYATKCTLVKMTVLPILDYGDIIYRMAPNTALKKLDTIYHSAIRFATNAPFHTHHCDLYKLGWPSLHTRRLHHWFLFIYKTILGKTPLYLSSLLHAVHNTYYTRSSNLIKFSTPPTSTTFGRNAFRFAAVYDWNILQNTLKLTSLIPISTFKQNLQNYIVDSCSC